MVNIFKRILHAMQTKIIVFCCVNLKINVYTMTKKVKKKKNTKLGFKSELMKKTLLFTSNA